MRRTQRDDDRSVNFVCFADLSVIRLKAFLKTIKCCLNTKIMSPELKEKWIFIVNPIAGNGFAKTMVPVIE